MRTNSFATLYRNQFWLRARGMLFSKYQSPMRQIRLVRGGGKGSYTHGHKKKLTKFRLKNWSEPSAHPERSAQIAFDLDAGMVKHDNTKRESPNCLLETHEEIGHPSCALPVDAGQRTWQTTDCECPKWSLLKKSSSFLHKGRRRALPLLRWHTRLSRCNFQFWYRVRSSWFGSRKGKKSRNILHISAPRENSQEPEVLPSFCHPNTESKDLIREGCENNLQKLGKNERVSEVDGSELAGETQRQTHSAPNVLSSGQPAVCGRGRANHILGSCEGSDLKTRLQLEKPERPKMSRVDQGYSSGIRGLEIDTQTLLASGPPPGNGEDKQAALRPPCLVQGSGPLWDHHYCRTTVGASNNVTHGKKLNTVEVAPDSQLFPKEITNEAIKELIHEYLKKFYGKHGSFIPLSKSDMLRHLNCKLNADLKNRKSFINTELNKYQAGLASVPMHCFKVVYNKHTLTLEDLSTLDSQNWVNDQVINMYGELIMEAVNHKVHFFNSFFYRQLVTKGYEGVKRWTKKVDLFTKKLLLIPIHLEIHWSLITVDIATWNIHFYDSQSIVFRQAVENILKYIMAEAKDKERSLYQKGWKIIIDKRIPQQRNENDCGVFVLEYCKCLALGKQLQFSQADMPKIRKRIYKELCDCKLRE